MKRAHRDEPPVRVREGAARRLSDEPGAQRAGLVEVCSRGFRGRRRPTADEYSGVARIGTKNIRISDVYAVRKHNSCVPVDHVGQIGEGFASRRSRIFRLGLGLKENARKTRVLIGWREWLALPALNVDRIKAKVDTGARTSALHAEQVTYVRRRGQTLVQFVVSSGKDSANTHAVVQAPLLDERRVRSSNGKEELRPVIETVVRLGTQEWSIEVTLTRRDQMGFPMLLGRQALKGHAVVDPGRSFLNAKKIVKAIKPPEE